MIEFRSESVPIEDVVVPKGRRKHRDEHIDDLAQSIEANGLLNPVALTDDYNLVAGLGRFEATKRLGRKTIEARIGPFTPLTAELAEIDENLVRDNLDVLQEAQAMARRKAIYEELYPEGKQHAAGGVAKANGNGKPLAPQGLAASDNLSLAENHTTSEEPPASFAKDTAAKTGKSMRTVQRLTELGEKIDPEAAAKIAGTAAADNQSELKALADLAPWEQQEVAEAVADGKEESVREAVAKRKPKAKSKAGKPTVDVRLFAALEKAIGAVVRANTELMKSAGGKEFHDRIRRNNNDSLEILKEWRATKVT